MDPYLFLNFKNPSRTSKVSIEDLINQPIYKARSNLKKSQKRHRRLWHLPPVYKIAVITLFQIEHAAYMYYL